MMKYIFLFLFASIVLPSNATIMIDVRSEQEFAQGHHEKAVLLPVDLVKTGIATLVPDKQEVIYLYCRSGNRAQIALKTLKALGYSEVYNLGSLQDAEAWFVKHPDIWQSLRRQ